MASIYANLLEQKKVFALEKNATPRGLVWNTNMAAVSLFWNTNIAAVTSQLKPGGVTLLYGPYGDVPLDREWSLTSLP